MRARPARRAQPLSSSLKVELLGAVVIRQAIEDATNPRLPQAARHDARAFLACGGPTLRLWCTVAGIDASAFKQIR